MSTLYYIHDPMCSWCWAFRPTFTQLLTQIPAHIEVVYLLGGLAPDSDTPMSQSTQIMIQEHWHTIKESVPNTLFNFDFWNSTIPRRSTYPACRAVLAAKAQSPTKEDAMILAIQQAYYLHAKNPSLDNTLIRCAAAIGLNIQQFKQDLHAPATQQQLQSDIQHAQRLGAAGFPSLVLSHHEQCQSIAIDYNHTAPMLQPIKSVTNA